MRHNKRIFIISAEKSDAYDTENRRRMIELWHDIERLGLLAQPSMGSYEGVSEASIVITERDSDDLRELLLGLSKSYDQDCIMVREPSGSSYLISLGGADEYIGEWRLAPEVIAKQKQAYTLVDGNHYITSKF